MNEKQDKVIIKKINTAVVTILFTYFSIAVMFLYVLLSKYLEMKNVNLNLVICPVLLAVLWYSQENIIYKFLEYVGANNKEKEEYLLNITERKLCKFVGMIGSILIIVLLQIENQQLNFVNVLCGIIGTGISLYIALDDVYKEGKFRKILCNNIIDIWKGSRNSIKSISIVSTIILICKLYNKFNVCNIVIAITIIILCFLWNKILELLKCRDWIKFVKCFAAIFFGISIFLIVRWSDYPVIESVLFNNKIFIHNEEVDSTVVSVVTGYFSGYLVYILTVVIPDKLRKRVFTRLIIDKLISIYNDYTYIMLLMGKNTANEKEWSNILKKNTDIEVFNENYYKMMEKFDVMSEADTMLMKLDENGGRIALRWYEYLKYKVERWESSIADVMLRYHIYMEDGIVQCLTEIQQSALFELILGNGVKYGKYYESKGIYYYENLPISMFYEQCKEKDKLSNNIFSKYGGCDGSLILKACNDEFFKLYAILKKYVNNERIKSDANLRRFKENENLGHLGSARNMRT